MFQWEGSQIEGNHGKQLEQTIVEYNDIFARHRLDIGINNSFKVKLTPKDERPIHTQSLSVPINLKEDLTVELALMHRYGIITTPPFSKYASPIFAQRKPNGKLRLLVDLGKINALISDDYINNNHSVSTLSDAAQHLAGKKIVLQTRLLTGISLPTDGRPTINRNASLQLCKQNVRLQTPSTRTEQSPVGIFKIHARILG